MALSEHGLREAIQPLGIKLDCFVALLLAMTGQQTLL
jgi:hypothetical protein